jgi:hypothetical protein
MRQRSNQDELDQNAPEFSGFTHVPDLESLMPSPFPGMDPYLEDPRVFPDFHNGMIFCLQAELKSKLPRPYFATTGRRTWIEVSERFIQPDVNVLRPGGPRVGAAIADVEPDVARGIVIRVPHDEREEPYLEICREQDGNRRLVTSVEILSPTNKTPGEHGRELYLQKQQEMIASAVNFVEVDLLRGGHHSTAVPLRELKAKAGPLDYHVCIHRFDQWQDYTVFPILLSQQLPKIPFPLLPEDGHVVIDLQ